MLAVDGDGFSYSLHQDWRTLRLSPPVLRSSTEQWLYKMAGASKVPAESVGAQQNLLIPAGAPELPAPKITQPGNRLLPVSTTAVYGYRLSVSVHDSCSRSYH
jgi:hypothetical protein